MQKETIKVSGMSCAACSQSIEKTIGRLDGVVKASVNLASESLSVSYDEKKVSLDKIKETVKELGYDIREEKSSVTMAIGGMTCAACSGRVEKILRETTGVYTASVNLATEKATLSYDPSTVKLSFLKESVEKAGYKVLEVAGSADEDRKRKEKEIKTLRIKFIIAVLFAMPLLYIAMAPMLPFPLYIPAFLHPDRNPLSYAITQLILVIPVVVAGYKFYTVGIKALIKRSPNMDSLIAIGTSAAILYSLYSTYKIASGHTAAAHDGLYFESAGVIIALILLGKTLEAVSKGKTSDAIKKLMGLAPKTATVFRGGEEIEIPVSEVETGDLILVKPGDSIPVDGVVEKGYTSIDESMLTGESIPVEKKIGDNVYAAAINKNGTITIKATKIGADTVLAQIIKLVEDAQGSKAPIAKMADIVSGYFVPAVTIIAITAFFAWLLAGYTLSFSLSIFISVLVIACPCALGLATPTAIMVGTGKGAEHGILIKSGEALESAYKINTVILDKTGTVTEGKPMVTDILTADNIARNRLLAIAASGEKVSEHPLADAIVKKARDDGINLFEVTNFEAIPGHGIKADIDGEKVLIGNKKLMTENSIETSAFDPHSDRLADEGKTPMYIAIDGKAAGIIAVADVLKKSSVKAVEKLHSMGIEVIMITGDNKKTADAIAKTVKIDRVLSEVLPQDKAKEVEKLQAMGKKVAMVGDGINDAPALVKADIGIAIGTGTDIAMESADIVLMKGNLMDVAAAINLSRSTIRNIKENLFWAFGYNAAGIPLAAGLFYAFGGPLLNPMFAAAAMSLSSVSVVTNALRLKRFRPYK